MRGTGQMQIVAGLGAIVAAFLLCLPAGASAGTKQLTGELEVNGADITIDALQKDHRIRRITDFEVMDNDVGGIPVNCTGSGEMDPGDTYLGYPGAGHSWKVARDRSFSVAGAEETTFVGLEIEGRFSKDRRSVAGTINFDGFAFEEPWYCHTDGVLDWDAGLAPG